MTDARFPERYLNDRRVRRLNATEIAGWTFATIWSVSNRTDGEILADDLALIPYMTEAIASKLSAAGLWEKRDRGWLVVDFSNDQTSRDELTVLDNARRRDREKKARQRAAKADANESSPPGQSPGMSRGRVPGTAQERQEGQAGRTGHVVPEEKFANESNSQPVTTWPTVMVPSDVSEPDWSAPYSKHPRRCVVCSKPLSDDQSSDYCEHVDDAAHRAHEATLAF